ncbi:hypothetical protein AB0M44_45820 [Streptosporangium subroseum]|uniref:hypothetical protein n=1 Tax=Streptosporangium subroseum TaxID=106412 RepID=UPI0034332977
MINTVIRRLLASFVVAAMLIAGFSVIAVTQASHAYADSTVGGPITRAEVLARAQTWVDRRIQYNLTRSQGSLTTDPDGAHKYGPDCSGYVSMAWHLSPGSAGGLNTSGFAAWSGKSYLGSLDDLKPGDALLKDGHIELFARWKDDGNHGQGAYVYSLNGGDDPDGDGWQNDWAKFALNSWSEMVGYRPIRYNNIVDSPSTDLPNGEQL